jgi:hypothetical protein
MMQFIGSQIIFQTDYSTVKYKIYTLLEKLLRCSKIANISWKLAFFGDSNFVPDAIEIFLIIL